MNRRMKSRAFDGGGKNIDPGAAVIPIMKELERGRLAIIGTGFYISRYGLFLTAAHVFIIRHRPRRKRYSDKLRLS